MQQELEQIPPKYDSAGPRLSQGSKNDEFEVHAADSDENNVGTLKSESNLAYTNTQKGFFCFMR